MLLSVAMAASDPNLYFGYANDFPNKFFPMCFDFKNTRIELAGLVDRAVVHSDYCLKNRKTKPKINS
jgi:hypothetical protein